MSPTRRATDTHDVDVIVVGGGGSGLAAAVSAAQAGASVLVLESQARPGGTSRMAVGSISAAGTELQRRAGIVDSAQDFVTDMQAFTADLLAHDNAPLREVLAKEAAPTVEWLRSLGVVFVGPYPEPPHRVERMHNAIPGAAAIVDRLLLACRRLGVRIQTQVVVRELNHDAKGRVHGVVYEQGGQRHEASAQRAVILASGDFSGNEDMRAAHLATEAARAMPINPGNTGLLFEVSCQLGAQPLNMGRVFGPQMRFPSGLQASLAERMPNWPWLSRLAALFFEHAPSRLKRSLAKPLLMAHMSPSEQLFVQGAVLVDEDGHRLDHQRPAQSIAMTASRRGFIVMDDRVARQFNALPYFISTAPGIAYAFLDDYRKGRPDITFQAADIASLARALGMRDDRELHHSLAGKTAHHWVALGPVQAMLTTTEGSLAINGQCQVLGSQAHPIEGLYAVGCIGQGGLLLRGHGLHLAWAYTSGRLAGAHAAARQTMEES